VTPSDAGIVLELTAVAPHALGGLVLRGAAGPQCDRVCAAVRQLLGEGAPWVRVPVHATDDRLLGGLSLAASLQQGRPLFERGLLAAADGGMLILPMAERMELSRTALLCSMLDRACLSVERDGMSRESACSAGVLALDEGSADECLHEALRDRLAFHLDLDTLAQVDASAERASDLGRGVAAGSGRIVAAGTQEEAARGKGATDVVAAGALEETARGKGATAVVDAGVQEEAARAQGAGSVIAPSAATVSRSRVLRARETWSRVCMDESWVVALCEGALTLGVTSLRAPLLAARAAQVHAALSGRLRVEEEDVIVAARWVLGPRATALPVPDDGAEAEQVERHNEPTDDVDAAQLDSRQELIVAAAKSGMPRQVFASISRGRAPALGVRARARALGKAGAQHTARGGGRPIGVRRAPPSSTERLHVLETLRAAAPWQRLRGREAGGGRVVLRKDDLRVRRYERRSETTVIFSVDASGSAALQRLGEAKGAVEQLLIDCYARRDHVALVAFRERAASLLLAPTRSLTRVHKSLAQLAGGGATPLAAGIDAAAALAVCARKQGSLPIVVLMTDARANIARDGEHGSASAMRDALAAARELRAQSIVSLFLDTSPRPREQAQRLAAELGAHYLPLPYLNAAGISAEVRALSTAVRSRA
jgi:magnesium chelatase subunit D